MGHRQVSSRDIALEPRGLDYIRDGYRDLPIFANETPVRWLMLFSSRGRLKSLAMLTYP